VDYLSQRGQKVAQVQKQLKVVEDKISTVESKYLLKADVSESTYNKVIGELRADQSRLYKELTKLNTNYQAYWNRLGGILAKFTDIRAEFASLAIEKKHQFVNWVFDGGLSYGNDIYRTPSVPELFAHNLLTLKEKGLLEIVAPVRNIGDIPDRSGIGSPIEHSVLQDIDFLCRIFIDVA